jgi:hypothetical protein
MFKFLQKIIRRLGGKKPERIRITRELLDNSLCEKSEKEQIKNEYALCNKINEHLLKELRKNEDGNN